MELPIAVVPVYADNFCRACFKELNTTTAAEANARVNMLEMPGLMDKLSACISNIFIITKRGSKYLCPSCYEKINEFYEFREMCLQSIRRFEETQTYKPESIKFIKEENELNNQEMVSNRNTASTILTEALNQAEETFEGSIENDNLEVKSECNSANKRTRNKKGKVIQTSVDDLETVVSAKNEPISNESEEELNFDDFHEDANYTPSETTRKAAKDKAKKRRYFCDECQKGFNKEENLIAHIQKHEGLKPYLCTHEGCSKSFSWPKSLKLHKIAHHNPNVEKVFKRFRCTYEGCSKSFSWSKGLRRHEMTYHNYPNTEYVFKRESETVSQPLTTWLFDNPAKNW